MYAFFKGKLRKDKQNDCIDCFDYLWYADSELVALNAYHQNQSIHFS